MKPYKKWPKWTHIFFIVFFAVGWAGIEFSSDIGQACFIGAGLGLVLWMRDMQKKIEKLQGDLCQRREGHAI